MKVRSMGSLSVRAAVVLAVLAGSVALISSTKPPFQPNEKAYYLDEAKLNFVRPGLVFTIQSATIAADGTMKVQFKITDKAGAPLDRLGVMTPGSVSSSFVMATIPAGQRQYTSYTTVVQTSPITGVKAVQAGSDNPTSAANYQQVGEGTYVFTFTQKAPASMDRKATHTAVIYGNRNLSEFDLGTSYADTSFDFIPDGGAVTVVRDVIATKTCNKCHDQLGLHGGSRRTMPVCVVCHQPQTIDPDTGNTVDMPVMIHKIHMGAQLPSVEAGGKYTIIGFNQSVHDYSDIVFPAATVPYGPRNCQMCHEEGTKQADAWLANPNRAACGACHDNVNFATGEGHLGLPQPSDNQCKNCHTPEGELEFDASIKGAHTIPQKSSYISGVVAKITAIENNKAGQKPVVTFTLTDKWGAPLTPAMLNRVGLTMAGPTTDYVGASARGYVTETVTASNSTASGNAFRYSFTAAIPADAKGSYAMGIEARRTETILAGTQQELTFNVGSPNDVKYFSVDGSAVAPRRAIAQTDRCNVCHGALSLHGENRNQVEMCILCHNPVETDVARRPASAAPPEGIDFALMVHRIHAGKSQIRDYTVYGFGNTAHNYNKVGFPGLLNSCNDCHADNTWNVPVAAVASKTDPRGLLNPVKPATGACTGCHTSVDAASHALANTTTLGESCGACHGVGAAYDVNKVHAQ